MSNEEIEKKYLLAFEYAVVLIETAKAQNKEITKELIEKAEVMLANEFKDKTPERLAIDMQVNILSVFETNTG